MGVLLVGVIFVDVTYVIIIVVRVKLLGVILIYATKLGLMLMGVT